MIGARDCSSRRRLDLTATLVRESLEQLPAVYERPFERWSRGTKKKEQGTEPVPLAVREGELSAQRELLSVLRLVDAGKVAVSNKTRRASSATMDAIAAVLDGGDFYPFEPPKDDWYDENAGPMRAFAWPLLVQAGGLAQLSGSRLQLTKAGRKALVEPAAHTLKTLWEKWTDTTLLDRECFGILGCARFALRRDITRRSGMISRGAVRFSDEVYRTADDVGPWAELPLRPYQDAAHWAWQEASRRCGVVLPTGRGKTRGRDRRDGSRAAAGPRPRSDTGAPRAVGPRANASTRRRCWRSSRSAPNHHLKGPSPVLPTESEPDRSAVQPEPRGLSRLAASLDKVASRDHM